MNAATQTPLGPLLSVSDAELPEWALQQARSAGLGKVVDAYPEQLINAAANARRTIKALEDELSGIALGASPTWELS